MVPSGYFCIVSLGGRSERLQVGMKAGADVNETSEARSLKFDQWFKFKSDNKLQDLVRSMSSTSSFLDAIFLPDV